MHEIIFVTTEDGDALYLDGELYDYSPNLYIYDLLGLLKSKGIAETKQINFKLPEQPRFVFPNKLKDLK